MTSSSFDPIWEEEIYSKGCQLNRYPYDAVVQFVYRHAPRSKDRSQVKVLEVGCGAGNNLWFAAREGFQVTGIDASESAISFARRRFAEERLEGEFVVGDMTDLPFASESFDLAIDRAAITCLGRSAADRAIAEIHRVLTGGGKFLFNPYSDAHSSYLASKAGDDDVRTGIFGGTLVGVGQIRFYGRDVIEELFATGWRVVSAAHLELTDTLANENPTHAEWRVVVEKVV